MFSLFLFFVFCFFCWMGGPGEMIVFINGFPLKSAIAVKGLHRAKCVGEKKKVSFQRT